MAPTFSYESLAGNIGVGTEDGMRNVVNTAADFVCNLWQDYSEFTSSWADPTGVGKFNNALFSRLCNPRGKQPPNPPIAPFTGGQCNKLYRVTGTYRYGPNAQTSSFIFNNLQGPIQGLGTAPTGTPGRSKYGIRSTPNINWPTGLATFLEGNDPDVRPVELLTLIPTPVTGPDNCGDPTAQFPPKLPGPNDVKKNVNVNVGAGVVIVAPVTLIPTRFDIDAEINPQLNVSVGPFNVTFDAGGVTLSPNFNFGGQPKVLPPENQSPVNILPPQDQKPGTQCPPQKDYTSRFNTIDNKLNTLEELAEDIQECTCPVGYQIEAQNIGSGNSGVVVLPSNTIQVRLTLTQIPQNAKTQYGGEDAPLQYFCGYYSFGDGVGLGARVAINTAQSVFEVPIWATSFSWSLYTGYRATVTRITLVPEKPDAELVSRQMKLKPA